MRLQRLARDAIFKPDSKQLVLNIKRGAEPAIVGARGTPSRAQTASITARHADDQLVIAVGDDGVGARHQGPGAPVVAPEMML